MKFDRGGEMIGKTHPRNPKIIKNLKNEFNCCEICGSEQVDPTCVRTSLYWMVLLLFKRDATGQIIWGKLASMNYLR